MVILGKLKWLLDRALHFGGYGCSDTEQLLFDYIQGELPTEIRAKLDKHFDGCTSCQTYVNSYRKTIAATREYALPGIEMPLELQRRLKEFIAQNPNLR